MHTRSPAPWGACEQGMLVLINCVVYQEGKKLADIPVQEIRHHLDRPGCFVWVALRDATAQELRQMQQEFSLHELAVEDALHGHQRPKIEEYGAMVFVVMHLLEMPSDSAPIAEKATDGIAIGEVAIFVGANFVLSVRNRSSQNFLGVRARCEHEPQLLRHGAGFVLYALMDAVVDRYFPILEQIETDLEEIESQIFEGGAARSNVQRLYALKRRASVLRHAVAPLLEAAGKLHGGRVPEVCLSTQEYFRDIHDHLARMNAAIDAIRDTIGMAMQVNRFPGHDRRVGGDQAARRVGSDFCRLDGAGRYLGHEFRAHARAQVGLGLSLRAGPDRHRCRHPLLALQARRMVVKRRVDIRLP